MKLLHFLQDKTLTGLSVSPDYGRYAGNTKEAKIDETSDVVAGLIGFADVLLSRFRLDEIMSSTEVLVEAFIHSASSQRQTNANLLGHAKMTCFQIIADRQSEHSINNLEKPQHKISINYPNRYQEGYEILAAEYFSILSNSSSPISKNLEDHLQWIIEYAEDNEGLAILLNEVDYLLSTGPENANMKIEHSRRYRELYSQQVPKMIGSRDLKYCRLLTDEQAELANLYCQVLVKTELEASKADMEKIQHILKAAEFDDTLAFVLNEVDALISQNSVYLSENIANSEHGQESLLENAISLVELKIAEYRRLFPNLNPWSSDTGLASEVADLRQTAVEYHYLMTMPNLPDSVIAEDRLQSILAQAESDERLAILLNEVDTLILEDLPSDPLTSTGSDKSDSVSEKLSAVLQTQMEVWQRSENDPEIEGDYPRLMTRVSSLLAKLSNFKTGSDVDNVENSVESIFHKLEALELLKEAMEQEKVKMQLHDILQDDSLSE